MKKGGGVGTGGGLRFICIGESPLSPICGSIFKTFLAHSFGSMCVA